MSKESVILSGEALQGVESGSVASLAAIPQQVRLGRKRRKSHPSSLRLGAYLNEAAAKLPPSTNRRNKASSALARMYGNDTYGDCVIAGKAHLLGLWAAADESLDVEATDTEILSQYQSICGPGDNGCVITDVLDVMRSRGFVMGGKTYTIDGYVSIDWHNKLEIQVALYLLGGLTIGINLPQAWTQQSIWDVTNTRIVGGHDVTVLDYDEKGVYVASWARVYLLTWAALTSTKWVEECYAILGPLWYGTDRVAPSGVNVDGLKVDLDKLGKGIIPPLPDVVDPPTPPNPSTGEIVTLVGLDRNGKEVKRFTNVASQTDESTPPNQWR